jgi:hypothetical protein
MVLVGKPEGKRPLERPRRRWVGNIKMDLWGIVWDAMGWIDLAPDRDRRKAFVNIVTCWVYLITSNHQLYLLHHRRRRSGS